MLNLTSSPIMLISTQGSGDIFLSPAGRTAREHIRDSYLLSGEQIHTGSIAIDAATLQPANADQIVVAQPLPPGRDTARPRRERRRRHGPGGPRRASPRRSAPARPRRRTAPRRAAGRRRRPRQGDPADPSRPPPPRPSRSSGTATSQGTRSTWTGQGVCTNNPTTDEIGHADTWEQLQWMAVGAEPFERGGRLWALNNRTRTVLYMADIRLDQDPDATQPEEQR